MNVWFAARPQGCPQPIADLFGFCSCGTSRQGAAGFVIPRSWLSGLGGTAEGDVASNKVCSLPGAVDRLLV